MTQVDVDATLFVDDGAGGSRAASVNDFKTPATGAASETNLTALKTANHADLTALATAVALLATDAHFQAFVAANHTDLAAVVAKLSGDPATQTTLAALVSANHADLAAIVAKDEAIRAILAAGIGVTGPLTDTQLRASAVPVDTELPAGASSWVLPTALNADGGLPTHVQNTADDFEITATTYTNQQLTSKTERRPSDSKTRTWTYTYNADGTLATKTVTAWA